MRFWKKILRRGVLIIALLILSGLIVSSIELIFPDTSPNFDNLDVGGGYNVGGISLFGTGSNKGSGWFATDILVAGNITSISDLQLNGSFYPDQDALRDIGSGTLRWRNANYSGKVQAGNFVGDGSLLTGILSGQFSNFRIENVSNTTKVANILDNNLLTKVGDFDLRNISNYTNKLENNSDMNITTLIVKNITSSYANKSYIYFQSDGSVGITLDPIYDILPIVYAQEQQDSETKEYTGSTETTCKNGKCNLVLYSGTRFAQDKYSNWVKPSDVLKITKDSDDLTFHYDGIKGYYNITFETGVIYNGNYYSMQDIKALKPTIQFNFPIKETETNIKYTINITDIPLADQSKIGNITLTYKSHSGFTIDELKSEIGRYLIKDIFELVFDDLKENNFIVDINKAEKRIYIGNISDKFVTNSLYLDPTIKLQEANTQNLEDTDVDQANPDSTFGKAATNIVVQQGNTNRNKRSYIKFNISGIPSGQQIDNVSLYILYDITSNSGTFSIDAHHVYNQSWTEENITWNEQPCGTAFTNGDLCNLTREDRQVTPAQTPDYFMIWNVTSATRRGYNDGNKNLSFIIKSATESATTPRDYKFGTKEDSASDRPYLNITYSEIPSTDPTISTTLTSPANASIDTDGIITFNCSATPTSSNVTNITLYHNSTGIFNAIQANSVNGSFETAAATGFEVTGISNNTFLNWNCLSFNNASNSSFASANYTLTVLFPTHIKRPRLFVQNLSSTMMWYVDSIGDMWLKNDLTIGDDTILNKLNVTDTSQNSTFQGDVKIIGTLYGGSIVRISGGLNITDGILITGTGYEYLTSYNRSFILEMLGNSTINRSISLDGYNKSVDLSSYNKSISLVNYNQSVDLSNYQTGNEIANCSVSNSCQQIVYSNNGTFVVSNEKNPSNASIEVGNIGGYSALMKIENITNDTISKTFLTNGTLRNLSISEFFNVSLGNATFPLSLVSCAVGSVPNTITFNVNGTITSTCKLDLTGAGESSTPYFNKANNWSDSFGSGGNNSWQREATSYNYANNQSGRETAYYRTINATSDINNETIQRIAPAFNTQNNLTTNSFFNSFWNGLNLSRWFGFASERDANSSIITKLNTSWVANTLENATIQRQGSAWNFANNETYVLDNNSIIRAKNMTSFKIDYHNLTGLPTCTGNDKYTSSDGLTISCATDQTGAGGNSKIPREITMWRSDVGATGIVSQGLNLPAAVTLLDATFNGTCRVLDFSNDIGSELACEVQQRTIVVGSGLVINVSIRDINNFTRGDASLCERRSQGAVVRNDLNMSNSGYPSFKLQWFNKPSHFNLNKTVCVYTAGGNAAADFTFPRVILWHR